MAKATFYNLPEEKQEKIYGDLREIFETRPLADVRVADIVKKTGMARGSFYQYFDDLYDAYFSLMERETEEIHLAFYKFLKENDGKLEPSFEDYGDYLETCLYDKNKRKLYKCKFLNMDPRIEARFEKKTERALPGKLRLCPEKEMEINFIKYIVHGLVLDSLIKDYPKEKFRKVYDNYCKRILKGVGNATNGNIF